MSVSESSSGHPNNVSYIVVVVLKSWKEDLKKLSANYTKQEVDLDLI